MPVWVAILIAVVATSLMNFGMALQKKGAASLPKIGEEKGGRVFKAFMTSRLWGAGWGLMMCGWGLYLVSTKFAPISIIQPTLGVGLAILALFSVFYLQEKIRALEWAAFAAMLAGMILLGLSATDEAMPPLPEWPPLLGVTAAVLGLSALTYVLGKRGVLAGIRTDSLLGMVSGLFIGLAALYTKAMFTFLEDGQKLMGLGVCLTVVLAANIAGLIVIQSGFQRGKALVVVSLEAVINKVVAIVGGMIALAEFLPEDPARSKMRIAAFVLILFGTAALARFGGAELADKMDPGEQEPDP
jgi:drug/metabolite transporter (DMT)-like permease